MNDKATGSFYTPNNLIKYMITYARERIAPLSILEPSAGDGRFVDSLKEFACPITLIEYDKEKIPKLEQEYGESCDIVCKDYLQYAMENDKSFDLVIGNPPYITKKVLPVEQSDISEKLISHFELDKMIFQNAWVSFILASVKLLSPQGAVFFVLPFEFLQVQYAEKLRFYLEKRFNTIEITTFEDRVFTEIEQDICLVYLGNEPKSKPYIKYTTLVSASNQKETFQSTIMRNKPLKKWSNCILNDNETEVISSISEGYYNIDACGDISPGIVSGANSFFIRSKQQIDELKIPQDNQLPIVSKSSFISPLLLFGADDLSVMEEINRPTRLMNLTGMPQETFSRELVDYIKSGENERINERYKCSKRKRWYDVPIIKRGEVCFFKRFHFYPRVIVNCANAFTTDVAYNIRLKEGFDAESFAFCFYNSMTLALCEYHGRFYGGGVGELVPSEFKAVKIPYKYIDKASVLHLDDLFRGNASLQTIVDYVDSIVLSELPDGSLKMLQNVRSRYIVRRMKQFQRKDDAYGE